MDAKKKKNLEETYERILNVGFCIVPYEDISDIIGPDPMVYGTAKDERILSFEGVEALFKSQYEQMGNMKPAIDRKRIALRISNGGNNACIIEELTFTLSSDEEIHTIFMRATCVMEYLDNQWKITHWHTSTPVDTENDPWHMEEWKREKEKLQQLVDQQTAALKQNNRELQIEAALEKIRSSSLAMQKTEDLREVVKVLFEQMQGLSVDMGFASVSIFIFEDGSRNIRQWLPLPDGVSSMSVPYFNHPISSDLFDAKESGEDFFTKIYTLEEKNTWLAHGFEHTDYKDLPVDFKSSLLQAPGYGMAITLAKNSGICIPSFEGKLPTPEDIQIMKRVGKVFEQAYIRFLDLQKAEAQAREAQIQLSLERVRARSMAMQSSDELHDVLSVLFRQFDNLGIQPVNVFLSLFDRENRTLTYRASGKSGTRAPGKQVVEVDSMKPLQALYDKWINDNSDSVEVIFYPKEVLPDLFGIFADTFATMPEEDTMTAEDFPEGGYSMAGYTPFGYLGYDHQRQATAEEKDILSRFCLEFTRVYQRFLDIQKAEAQAREARIESALEKVRAQTMGMQSSKDLSEVASMMFNQMKNLGGELFSFAIVLCDKHKNMVEQWHNIGNEGMMSPFFVPIDLDYIHQYRYDQWMSGAELFSIEIPQDYIVRHFELMFDLPSVQAAMAEAASEGIKVEIPEWEIDYGASFRHGYLLISSFQPHKEDHIFPRFAKVFDQAYTRFLDLQKAEAQAWEAQIQLALERVRARTMAMQNSDELMEVSMELFTQFKSLGELSDQFSIGIFDEDKQAMKIYATLDGEKFDEPLEVNRDYHEVPSELWKSWKSNKKSMTIDLSGESLASYNSMRNSFIYPKGGKTFSGDRWVIHAAFFSHGILSFSSAKHLPQETGDLLERFAKVFEQTYTRFLDLQKAEAQAREAQIEAALERVRSRSLAMHHSSELSAVVDTLLREFTNLEFTLTFCIINLIDEKDMSNIVWAANPETGKDPESYYMKFEDYPFHHAMWDAWKAQKKRFVYTIEGEEKKIYDQYLYNDTEFRRFPKNVQEANKALERYVAGFTFFKFSGLQTVSLNPISEDELEILERFGRVFEQAYTRFLDLQKAEAQAREAQIEAALERVRSASMAMHKTDELAKVVEMLFLQFSELDLDFYQVWINIFRLEEGVSDCWFSPVKGVINKAYTALVPLEPFENLSIKSWKAGEEFSYLSWNGLREVDKVMKELSALTNHPSFHQVQKKKRMKRVEIVDCNHKYGVIAMAKNEDITDNDRSILKRFANVFEQSYTRFLDLQKAEAQAREARIEAALERVRSKSLAMHDSQDLHEVVTIVFEQLESIGLFMNSVLLHELVYDSKSQHFWVAANGQVYPEQTEIPITKNAFFTRFEEARRNGESFFTQTLSKRQKDAFFEHYFKQSNHSDVPQKRKDYIYSCESLNRSTALHKYTALSVSRYDNIAYSKEENKVIKRFSQVFEQSYQRYLDLKKAEDQAREAQIVASMERVRAATMAMHQSDELSLVLSKLFEQFDVLGIKPSHAVLTLIDKEKNTMNFRTTGKNGYQVLGEQEVDLSVMNAWVDTAEKWKKSDPNAVNVNEYPPEILPEVWEVYKDILATMPQKARPEIKDFPDGLFITEGYCRFGYIGFAHHRKPSEEEKDIVRRIAAEFGTLYQRFLDLQKSEAQAREAQIEVALEKIRSRTMAMQKAEELGDVATVLFSELNTLVDNLWTCGFVLCEKNRQEDEWWLSLNNGLIQPFFLPNIGDYAHESLYEGWKNRRKLPDCNIARRSASGTLRLVDEYSNLQEDI
jgi:hypothetical protein